MRIQIRIRITDPDPKWLRIRFRKAQKHADPEHYRYSLSFFTLLINYSIRRRGWKGLHGLGSHTRGQEDLHQLSGSRSGSKWLGIRFREIRIRNTTYCHFSRSLLINYWSIDRRCWNGLHSLGSHTRGEEDLHQLSGARAHPSHQACCWSSNTSTSFLIFHMILFMAVENTRNF
jgi:hypothetical protein